MRYGLLAARAEILKVEGSGNPCLLGGFEGMLNSSTFKHLMACCHSILCAPHFSCYYNICLIKERDRSVFIKCMSEKYLKLKIICLRYLPFNIITVLNLDLILLANKVPITNTLLS